MTSILLALLLAAADGEEADRRHEAIREGVVAIRTMATLGERSGTGFFLDDDGLILTSHAVCPEGAKEIRVWTAGPVLYEGDAVEVVGHSRQDEVTLLRLKLRKGGKVRPLPGRPSPEEVRVGDVCFAPGNAHNAIINDDQVAVHRGIVSGRYRLDEKRAGSSYTGLVIETTAAVNVNLEGGPLLDREGRVFGMVTLNFSPERFLGCAIPMAGVELAVRQILEKHASADLSPETEGRAADPGMELAKKGEGVVLIGVKEGSAAWRAGLRAGDRLVSMGKDAVQTPEDVTRRIRDLKPGAILFLVVENEFGREEVRIVLEAKKPPSVEGEEAEEK